MQRAWIRTVANNGNNVSKMGKSRINILSNYYIRQQVSPFQRDEFIPENIFYKLCMKANNETARKFQDIVGDEILPAIRKNGGYIVTNDEDDEMTIMAKAILVAEKTIKGLKNKIDTLESANNLLKRNKEALRIEKEILEADNEILTAETQIQQQRLAEFEPIKDYVDTILASPDALAISQIAADYGMTGSKN